MWILPERLSHSQISRADLRGAKLGCDRVGNDEWKCAQLQGAFLDHAQLQGANLDGAQLQSAWLVGAQLQRANLQRAQLQGANLLGAQLQGALPGHALQGANLDGAQLQGASLVAQLQGANLLGAELQGANLDGAQLQGASLRGVFVWRTNPPLFTNGAFIDASEPRPKYWGLDCRLRFPEACDWTEASFAALKSVIESSVPAGVMRDQALKGIAVLEKPPYVQDYALVKAWVKLAEASARSADSYPDTLAKTLIQTGCTTPKLEEYPPAAANPYVVGGLTKLLDQRFWGNLSQEAAVAAAFLDEAKCPGARGLSEDNKAKLQEIRDRGLAAPPGPGAVVR
jgi:uncharacterized protein YjbI with pentapeptide repeats